MKTVMLKLFQCLFSTVLSLVMMISSFPAQANPVQEPEEAKQVRLELAEAFSRGDLDAIDARIHDSYSGLRFAIEGEPPEFSRAGRSEYVRALREAEVVSVEKKMARYKVLIFNQERKVTISPDGYGKWRLDYNMLAGPFPSGW